RIHSVAGRLRPNQALVHERPFRAPHHSVTDAGLVGGGSNPRPGEAALAHNGVLFLDELPEFRRNALESMRQPLEDGTVMIGRADVFANAHMLPRDIRVFCAIDAAGQDLLHAAVLRLGLSARSYHRMLRLARTIADLDGCEKIAAAHIAEGIQSRALDRRVG